MPDSSKSRWPRGLFLALLLGFVALNAVAFQHAGAMIRWKDTGERTPPPEQLDFLGRLRVLATGVTLGRPTNQLTPIAFGVEARTVSVPNAHASFELEGWYLPGEDEELVVIFFHGYADRRDSMLPHALAVLDLGFSALVVDFYGSGGSGGSGTSLGMFEARDVFAAWDWAGSALPAKRRVLYGRSMGGAAVLRAVAHEGARPDGVVVDATYGDLLSATRARFRRTGLPPTPMAELLVFWGSVRLGVNGFEQRPVDFVREVACPFLVLHAEDDTNVGREEARALFEGAAGWKRLCEYPGASHGGLLQSDPERWRRDMRELLTAVVG